MTDIYDFMQSMFQESGGTASLQEILLRVTVLLSAAVLVAISLQRSSAALRHLIWSLSLVGVLLIPLCYWAFPGWQWAVLPQPQQAAPTTTPVVQDARVAQIARLSEPRERQEAFVQPLAPTDSPIAELSEPPLASSKVVKKTGASIATPALVAAHRTWSWPVFLATAWAVGTLLGFIWLGIGIIGAWYVARFARPTTDPHWHRILQQLLVPCGFRRPIEVRQSPHVSVPMAWGLRRPVILVPADSATWSEATKRSVLLHELGHIRRGDCLMHLLGRLACVAYWFHPLVWLAARQLRKASEQAADDIVLSSNVAPPDYAEHLVGIAGQMRGLHLFGHAALPMASPSDLENRVLAILDPRRNHRSLKRKTCYALMLLAALVLIPCALLRLGYAEDKNSQGQTSTTESAALSPPSLLTQEQTVSLEKDQRQVASERLESLLSRGMLDEALASYRKQPISDRLTRLGEALKLAGRGMEMLALYQQFLLMAPAETDEVTAGAVGPDGLGAAKDVIEQIVAVDRGQDTAKLLCDRVAEHPREDWLHLRLGYLWWKTGQREKALSEFDRYMALRAKPSASWLGWLAQLCGEEGLTDKAVAYYQQALLLPITDEDLRAASMRSAMFRSPEQIRSAVKADLLSGLGELFRGQQRWPDAEQCYLDILKLDPAARKEAAEIALTAIWKAMGKENTLIEQLRKKLEADPDMADVHARLAKLLLTTGETRQGIEHYHKAAELAPGQLGYRLDLADALAKAGQDEQAVAEYAAVLKATFLRPPPRGRSVSYVSPETVLNRLKRFDGIRTPGTAVAPPVALQEALLKLYRDALQTKHWTPSEYVLRTILRRMTAILASRSDYEGVVALWLDYRKQMQSLARDKVGENFSRLDSLDGLINRLRQAVRDDPGDVWGRFILGDALRAAGQKQQALQVYDELSRSQPDNERVHRDLAATYQKLDENSRAIAEYQAVLKTQPVGSERYNWVLGVLGWANLRLGKTEQATDYFREALKHDPLNPNCLRGLRQAGGEAQATQPTPNLHAPPGEAALLQVQSEDLVARGQYDQAIRVCEQILGLRPTNVAVMVLLARAHLGAGREAEAIAAFERAHRMRHWTNTDYGALSELQRLYLKTGADEKLIALYTANRDYRAVGDLYRQRKQPQRYERYLLEQLEKTPGDVELRFYLAEDYLDNNRIDLTRQMLEQLRAELGKSAGISAQRLAAGFERLGEPAVALKLLEPIDYARQPDPNDWLGQRLMRLYAKTGQLPKALETCLIRLRNDPDGHRTLQIAQEITLQAAAAKDGRPLLEDLLKKLEGKVPGKVTRRFTGGVRACLRTTAQAQGQEEQPSTAKDPVAMLKKGRIVRTPAQTGTLLDFLDALAGQAGTAVDQSFRDRAALLPAPRIQRTEAPAFELLAEALTGLPVALEFTEPGYWAVYERGDKNAKASFAASGGAIFTFSNGCVLRRESGNLSGMGRLYFDPVVEPNVVGMTMFPQIIEAVDDHGRDIAVPFGKPTFYPSSQLTFGLRNLDPPARSISTLTFAAEVAVCTKWITLKSRPLDGDRPIVLKQQAATVTINPLRTVESAGRKTWHVRVLIEWSDAPSIEGYHTLPGARMHFLSDDGARISPSGMSTSDSGKTVEFDLSVLPDSFVPARTQLVVLLPSEVEVVPVQLHFKNVPIVEVTGK